MPFTFLYFGLPVISKELGGSALEIGGLFSIFTATTLVLRPLVGWALDRFGRKPFLVAALFLYAPAMWIYAVAGSMGDLYTARLIQGIGSSFLWTAANTIVADLTAPEERGRASGKLSEVTGRGGMVGALAAFALMIALPDSLGWQAAFLAFAGLTLLAALLAWKLVPETRPAQPALRDPSPISAPLIRLLAVVFVTGVPEAMLAPIYLTFLQDKFTTDIATLAWAFFPGGLVTVFLASRLGALSDRYGRAPMMALGLAGAGIVSLFMPRLPSLIWLAALYALNSLLWGLSEPAETALVADLTGHSVRGRGYGLYEFVESLGFTLGPALGGWAYDLIGREAPFYINGAVLIAIALWVMWALRPARISRPAAKG
jgi:MFS family permease